jgi:hypothetical protein
MYRLLILISSWHPAPRDFHEPREDRRAYTILLAPLALVTAAHELYLTWIENASEFRNEAAIKCVVK